jgi:hypothetical protein
VDADDHRHHRDVGVGHELVGGRLNAKLTLTVTNSDGKTGVTARNLEVFN